MAASLEHFCLKSIIQEFERIHFAATVANQDVLQRNCEFLLRKYSSELLSKLSKKLKLKHNYLDYLINEHLKYFFYDKFSENLQCPVEDIFCRLSNLTEISCPYCCSDEILDNIARCCPKIVLIDAKYSSDVTDTGIMHLYRGTNGRIPCPELKFLNITLTEVTHMGVEFVLQNLSSLEILSYVDVADVLYSLYKSNNLLVCEKKYNLIELNFRPLKFLEDDIVRVCLTLCPKLKSVKFCISDKDQLTLFNGTTLERLTLDTRSFQAPRINISNFLKINGSNLVYLRISKCTISVNDLAVCCPKLEKLEMEKVDFISNGSQAIFNCLKTCVFESLKDDSATTEAIRLLLLSSKKLQRMAFMYCDLSELGKTYILKCCEKQNIDLIVFQGEFEIIYIKDILVQSRSLLALYLWGRVYDGEIEIKTFAETLPNKPKILEADWITLRELRSEFRKPWKINHIPVYT